MAYFFKGGAAKILFTLVFISAVFVVQAGAEKPDLKDILKQADVARGNTSGLEWTVTIDLQGKDEGKRVLRVKAVRENSLAIFQEPADVKGQMLLMKKNSMWFVKPGVSKPISISPRQRLLGSASNADIASTNYSDDYDSKLDGEETVNGIKCYVFDLKGKSSKVSYDIIKYWVSKSKYLGVKAEFYSVSGKLLKTAYFKYDAMVEIGGHKKNFISQMRIEDAVVKDTVTVMKYTNVKTGNIPASEFNLETIGK